MKEYKKVRASDHFGYLGSSEKSKLTNGQTGIDKKENVLVVCCSNCGDYSHIDLNKLKEVTK
ncbi:hypothetical protein LCGC14_1196470 [marine sediment metagenome]|uniref:Uncharacterized protein n=1 Tax=marine sediment metagenome TaxID=412755 RepID=A0A0F9LI97_9ZZZZ